MAATQTAQARVTLTFDGNATKAAQALADALAKAGQAEDALQAKWKNRGRAGGGSAPAGPGGAPGSPFGPQTSPFAPPRGAGTSPFGPPGAGGGAGSAGANPFGGVTWPGSDTGRFDPKRVTAFNRPGLGAQALSGAMRMAGPVGMAVTAAKMGADAAIDWGKMEAENPFMSEKEKQRRWLQNRPLFGWMHRKTAEWNEHVATDIGVQAGRHRLAGDYGELRGADAARRTGLFNSLGVSANEAQFRAEALAGRSRNLVEASNAGPGYRATRVAGGDRSTLLGQRTYDEARQLQGAQDQLRKAMLERAAAEKQAAHLTKREDITRNTLEAARKDLAGATRERKWLETKYANGMGGRAVIEQQIAKEREARAKVDGLSGEYEGAVRAAVGGRQSLAQSQSAARQAERGLAEARLGQLEGREQTAVGQARNLGGMGRMGRLQSEMALKAVQQIGWDNVTDQERSLVRSVAPETAAKYEEQAGSGQVDRFARYAPDEYRDRLPDVRKQVDAERERVAALGELDVRQTADDMATAVAGAVEKLFTDFAKQIEEKIANIERDAARRNNMPD